MNGEAPGFRIKPEELLSVADMVADLYDEVSGAGGNIAGSYDKFTRDAATSHMQSAWQSVFDQLDGEAIFVEAYDYQYKGLDKKYQAIQSQLQLLEQACRTTAQTYLDRDQDTETNVNQTNSGVSPSGTQEV